MSFSAGEGHVAKNRGVDFEVRQSDELDEAEDAIDRSVKRLSAATNPRRLRFTVSRSKHTFAVRLPSGPTQTPKVWSHDVYQRIWEH